ncbi:uncharacterized protein [Mytilus edulis]|uniref:uncharacterized protein n=1 Tax=Mytilus edulis TaxID=6550 RepID=UPI0039EE085B
MDDHCAQFLHKLFRKGYSYNEMKLLFEENLNIYISVRHLRRLANSMGLYKRKQSNLEICYTVIQGILSKSSGSHGYRLVHQMCMKNNLVISMETVRLILLLDPEGVSDRLRRRLKRRQYISRGPNYMWHMDGYDKLKPYGIAIHGCIDGYSRNIIWLKAGVTNNDPKIVAGHYIQAVIKKNGFPRSMRSDFGTENKYVEQMQRFFHRNGMNSDHCYIYGSSTQNQRIECLWAIFRKQCSQFWRNLFTDLKQHNKFDGSFLDQSLIRFCFMGLIQEDIRVFAASWNQHKIRSIKTSHSPSGRPHIMYNMPELYDCEDFLCDIDADEVDVCLDECSFDHLPCDEDVYNLANILMAEVNWIRDVDPFNNVNLYIFLRNAISQDL